MQDVFKGLIAEIDALPNKQIALDNIKSRVWPLSNKPSWYHEYGDDESEKNMEDTMELNHYIKSYLSLLI